MLSSSLTCWPCGPCWHHAGSGSCQLHSVPFLMRGTEKKEKLLLPLLPFCLQHGWLKPAKQVKFIASHAERAAATWHHPNHVPLAARFQRHRLGHMGAPSTDPGHVAAHGTGMAPLAEWPQLRRAPAAIQGRGLAAPLPPF